MTNTYDDDDDEWGILNAPTDDHEGDDDANDQNQGYHALLDPDEEE